MWEPKDWDKYEQFDMSSVGDNKDASLIDIFEAGAEAMLKALPRMELGNIYNALVVDVLVSALIEHNVKAGYLVFIPSEETKDD